MTKADLIEKMAEKMNASKKDAAAALNAFQSVVTEALANGDDGVTLTGFGTFYVSDRAARTGRNPRTGEAIQIPAKKQPVFRAGKALREAIQ